MIGLLDPCLFDRGVDETAQEWTARLTAIVLACRDYGVRLVGTGAYDKKLWTQYAVVPAAFHGTSREARQAKSVLTELQKLRAPHQVLPLGVGVSQVQAEGLRELFGQLPEQTDWMNTLGDALLSACASGEPVCLFVRAIVGRNIRVHEHEGTVLNEVLVWQVALRLTEGGQNWRIPCVRNGQHLGVPWTARMDERLPADTDGGNYPFCPPNAWTSAATTVFRTVQSKPCWSDRRGNGWAWQRFGAGTATGSLGGHWDVLLGSTDAAELRIEALNIVPWPGKVTGRMPGDLDHVPEPRRARFRDRGWR